MVKVLWEVPFLGTPVSGFGVALLLACVSALWLTVWRAKREGIDPEIVLELSVWLMGGGFIGARLLFVVSHPETIQSVSDIPRLWQGGIVYYGCIIGGLVGSILYWYRKPFPFLAMADAVAPALAIGCAVGRMGCFLNGCCFGTVWNGPLAVQFPAGSLPWAQHVQQGLIPVFATHSLPVHPAQLYAVADGLILLAVLSHYFPRRRRDGEVMALLMVTYPVTRFVIESVRDDETAVVMGLTLSQAISVVIFLAGLASWLILWQAPAVRHADAKADLAGLRVHPPHEGGLPAPAVLSGPSAVPAQPRA